MAPEILDIRPFPQPQTPVECMVLPIQSIFAKQDGAYRFDMPQRLASYMVALFTKGHGQHFVDFQTHPYHAKSLLFIAQHQVHQWQVNPESDGLVIAFSKDFLYKSDHDRDILDGYRIFDYSLQSPMLVLSDAEYARFELLFHEMKDEFGHAVQDSFKQDILRNLLRTILLRAERLKRAESVTEVLAQYADFVRFKERVESDFPQTRNVKDYATALGYSPKQLNRMTKMVLDKGAKVFIDDRVLLEIKRLLTHTSLSIKEIAEYTGFDEPTNLVKFFKRYVRQTPTTFRQTLRTF